MTTSITDLSLQIYPPCESDSLDQVTVVRDEIRATSASALQTFSGQTITYSYDLKTKPEDWQI